MDRQKQLELVFEEIQVVCKFFYDVRMRDQLWINESGDGKIKVFEKDRKIVEWGQIENGQEKIKYL